jgi:hypothetical protein
VSRGPARVAIAAALAAGALGARAAQGPSAPDALSQVASELARLEERLGAAERDAAAPEPASARAERALAAGAARFTAGDLDGAAALLAGALELPEVAASPRRAEALFELGEALFRNGDLAGALRVLEAQLASPGSPHEREASLRALEALAALGRWREASAAAERARVAHAGAPPPLALYLAAKAAYHRDDLPLAERLASLRAVPAPFELAAAYLEGALRASQRALPEAAAAFERCLAGAPADARAKDVREMCALALGRVRVEAGDHARAIDAYALVSPGSPRFEEALQESAWADVKARRYERALRAAGVVADVSEGALLAPEATLLRGHLELRLERHGDAVATYGRVMEAWSPVREEVDALLALSSSPPQGEGGVSTRALAEVAPAGGAPGRLPSAVVRWAAERPEVARALAAVSALERAQAGAAEARATADRLEAMLSERWGLAASPRLDAAYARAESVETAAALAEASLAAEAARLAPAALTASEAYRRARAEREAAAAAAAKLPRTPEDVAARAKGRRARLAALDRVAFDLASAARASAAQAAAAQAWLARHGAADPAARAEVAAELAVHRDVLAGYGRELGALRAEAARAADAVGQGGGSAADDRAREALRAALGREWELLAPARGALAPAGSARDRAEAIEALRARAAELQLRADRARRLAIAHAREEAAPALARLAAERQALDAEAPRLAAARAEADELAGRAAFAALASVRGALSRLVLKAEAGVADVAWTRKRERVEAIQALSAEKAKDLAALDGAAKGGR